MSTYYSAFIENDGAACTHALREIILAADTMPRLLRPGQLPERLDLLDRLDAIIGYLDFEEGTPRSHARLLSRARRLRDRLESANEKLYEVARAEIVASGSSCALRQWLGGNADYEETGGPCPGLGFDLRDEIVSGVLRLPEPGETEHRSSLEMVPYQPTPVRHILDLIAAAKISESEVLIDLGSGLGHVPLLVAILTGGRAVGVEFQPAYAASAAVCAARLNVKRARFVAGDARVVDLSSGTVFYLFSPFTGSILVDVLNRLRVQSIGRQIMICSLGPCTRVLAEQSWLRPSARPDAERVTPFTSQ